MPQDWKDMLSKLSVEKSEKEKNISEENVVLARAVYETKVEKETLRVETEKRNGKPATIVSGFLGSDTELKHLTKTLKQKCGSGGSFRGDEILIQGDFRQKIADILNQLGYKTTNINF